MTSTIHWTLVAGLVALLSLGCGSPTECDDLDRALSVCDLSVPRSVDDAPQCGAFYPGEGVRLAEVLDEQGCDALYDSARRVTEDACRIAGWDCPEPLFDGALRPTRFPVFFVGGIDGSPVFDWNPALLTRVQMKSRTTVQHVPLPGWESTTTRTRALAAAVTASPTPVNLICYAVGGVDCRFLTSPHGLYQNDPEAFERMIAKVASVTTIATPHLGTNLADALLTVPDTTWNALAIRGVIPSDAASNAQREVQVRQALEGMTLAEGTALDDILDHDDRIYAQSWAAISTAPTDAYVFAASEIDRWCIASDGTDGFVHHAGTSDVLSTVLTPVSAFAEVVEYAGRRLVVPADGLVAVASARWQNFRGCVPADHYDVIGQMNDFGADPRTGFDAQRFYSMVLTDLAERGF